MKSEGNFYIFRLSPQADLKRSILQVARDNGITAGVVVTCVGSLTQYNLRFANREDGVLATGHFEIVSCTGTVSNEAVHLHLAVADDKGNTVGGHLLDGNRVYTTAEICLAVLHDVVLHREADPASGYRELVVKKRS